MFNIKQTLCVLTLTALSSQVVFAETAKLPPVINGMTVLLDASDINADGVVDKDAKGFVNIKGGISTWKNKSTLNGGSAVANNNFFSDNEYPTWLGFRLNDKSTIGFKKGGFKGSSITLIPANSNYTKFVVFKVNDVSKGSNLISSDSTALWLGQAVDADKQGVLKSLHNDGTSGTNYLTDQSAKVLDTKSYHIASTRYAKGLPTIITPALPNILRLDSKEIAFNNLAKPFANSATYIGMGNQEGTAEFLLDGEIAEVIIYNRALSNKEVNDVEKYLKAKWGGFKENKITTFTIAAGKKEKGKTFKLTGKSSSNLPVIFESATPSLCKVTGTAFNQLKLLAIGKCIVDAGVNGNTTYRSADPMRKTINVVTNAKATTPANSNGGGGAVVPVWLILLAYIALLRRRS